MLLGQCLDGIKLNESIFLSICVNAPTLSKEIELFRIPQETDSLIDFPSMYWDKKPPIKIYKDYIKYFIIIIQKYDKL